MSEYLRVKMRVPVEAYQPVTTTGEIADSNNPNHRNQFAGLTIARAMRGSEAVVISYGPLLGWPRMNWKKGDTIYLAGTKLERSQPAVSAFIQIVGEMMTDVELLVDPRATVASSPSSIDGGTPGSQGPQGDQGPQGNQGAAGGGGGGSGDIDGGVPTSVYGGIDPIDGGGI